MGCLEKTREALERVLSNTLPFTSEHLEPPGQIILDIETYNLCSLGT